MLVSSLHKQCGLQHLSWWLQLTVLSSLAKVTQKSYSSVKKKTTGRWSLCSEHNPWADKNCDSSQKGQGNSKAIAVSPWNLVPSEPPGQHPECTGVRLWVTWNAACVCKLLGDVGPATEAKEVCYLLTPTWIYYKLAKARHAGIQVQLTVF